MPCEKQGSISILPVTALRVAAHCLDSIFCSSQPTLRAFRNASPEFADMALNCLENTIKEWQELERQGFKM